MCRALSYLDVKNPDDRSVVSLDLVKGTECRRLPVAQRNLLTKRSLGSRWSHPNGCTQLNVKSAAASGDVKPYGPTNDTSDCAEFSMNRLGVAMTRTATTMNAIALNRFGPLTDA